MLEEAGPHRAARRAHGAHAEGHPPHRPARARRPLPPAAAGPRRPPRDRARRLRPRALQRAQDVRVRRPAPPRRRAHAEERDHAPAARARRCASRPKTSRSSAPSRSRARATVLMLDVSLSMEMRGRFLAAKKVAMALHALDQLAVPARLPRDGELRTRRPRGEAGAPSRGHLGLRVGHQHAARAGARPQDAVEPDRPQADHHDHRRRADRPHRRRLPVLRLPAVAAHDRDDAARGAALHQATTSASTRSCSRTTPTSATSSSA